jgi:ribosomal-protein-alanine N-acetyltransferase
MPDAITWKVETDRLRLREMEVADFDFIAEMVGDPEVMHHYPSTYDREQARQWLERQRTRYAEHGHGLWLAVLRATGQPVGQVGLLRQEVDGVFETEIGYLLHTPFWHQGLATEAARGVRHYAFTALDRSRVISLIRPANMPSQAVARRLGMTQEKEATMWGRTHLVFALGREAPGAAGERAAASA